jgi:hypothetical protein
MVVKRLLLASVAVVGLFLTASLGYSQPQLGNRLPAPENGDLSLCVPACRAKTSVIDGSWTPPAVIRTD